MERIVIVGGGIAGLTSALALGRAGHEVTVLERDVVPLHADADAAFAADRSGAPQAHQTHGFLARMQVLLRDRFPDVFQRLLDVGCTTLQPTADLGDPQPGDEDLKVLIVRRTTLEWVLRTAAVEEPNVTIRPGVGVAGLTAEGNTVTGVRLEDGTEVHGDIVIAATGRRGPVPAWLEEIGVTVDEQRHDSGLMYLSRWYHLPAGFVRDSDAKLGGDLGFVKFLAVPGDGDTLSVTLAVRADDSELRKALSDPDGFDRACTLLPGPDVFFKRQPDGANHEFEPIGGVRPMTGLLNRLRTFTDAAGDPTVLGFHALGDAHTCTNPLYGRGCSLAMVQALALADAIAAHPGDPLARARAFEAESSEQVEPWFEASVQMDRMGADPKGLGDGGGGNRMGAVFAAAATDPVLGRTFARFWNLLITPAELAVDAAFVTRAAEVMGDPEKYPLPERPDGPNRSELLEALELATA